jgi:hypothetical protein
LKRWEAARPTSTRRDNPYVVTGEKQVQAPFMVMNGIGEWGGKNESA